MAKIKIRDWVEPAHPVLVQRYDDLIDIYRFIKDSIQSRVDTVFDSVSKEIGFVVATTVPVTFEFAEGGKLTKIELTAKNLQGTLFEKEFSPVFEKIIGKAVNKIAAGSYPLYLIWHDALKLKLKTDWMEPAHFVRENLGDLIRESAPSQFRPGVYEPVHWFHAGIALDQEEEILIAAIDEVFTDLKLAERVAVARRESIKFVPGIREPAHIMPGIREPAHFRDLIDEMIDVRINRKPGPGVREPAHFRRLEEIMQREDASMMIKEMTAVMKKYGL